MPLFARSILNQRLARIFLRTFIILVMAWLGLSAFVAWKLTRRVGPIRPEPVPHIAWGTIEPHRLHTSDGQEIGAWLVRGDGPLAVILLHGNGDSRSSMLDEMRTIRGRGCSVLAITMRAHGDSTGQVNDIGYSARHDVVAAVKCLQQELPGKKLVIVGHSLGAAAAIFAASECAHQVNGYLLVAPYFDLRTAVWNRCDNYLFRPLSDVAYWGLRLWAPVMLPESPALISPADHIADIPSDVPVILLASRDEHHARAWEAAALCERIKSHGRLHLTAGRHDRVFAEHREDYLSALDELSKAVRE